MCSGVCTLLFNGITSLNRDALFNLSHREKLLLRLSVEDSSAIGIGLAAANASNWFYEHVTHYVNKLWSYNGTTPSTSSDLCFIKDFYHNHWA
jgi:hypothetical protein